MVSAPYSVMMIGLSCRPSPSSFSSATSAMARSPVSTYQP